MRLHHFPVVNARNCAEPGVRQHETAIQFLRGDRQRAYAQCPPDRARWPRRRLHGRIIILRTGRNANHLRFDVLRDFADLFDLVAAAGEPIERAATEIISEDDPDIPAPAGACESDSISMPRPAQRTARSRASSGKR